MLGLFSLGSAARNWTLVWQGFDDLAMSLESVDVADDRSSILITLDVINGSDGTLNIHQLDTGVRLSGRSIAADDQDFDDLVLDPGETMTLESTLQVTRPEVAVLEERLDSGDERWNITGRISVSVRELSEPVWVPFRFDRDVR